MMGETIGVTFCSCVTSIRNYGWFISVIDYIGLENNPNVFLPNFNSFSTSHSSAETHSPIQKHTFSDLTTRSVIVDIIVAAKGPSTKFRI
jgi:hypothetical protein